MHRARHLDTQNSENNCDMSNSELSPEALKSIMIAVSEKIIESEELLSEADRKLGDGDHGLGMKRGFTAAKEKLETLDPKTVGDVFTTTGMTLMASMGGASGAVMGMLFQSGGMALGTSETLDATGLSTFLTKALEGVTNIGKAKPGDKTMVDALHAAAEAGKSSSDQSIQDAFSAVAEGAEAGMKLTIDMIATLGRAKTLGERSIGHPDPGALSISIIFRTMSDNVGQ